MAVQLTKEAVRIRGIIKRARLLLVTASKESVKVVKSDSVVANELAEAFGRIQCALDHFAEDAFALQHAEAEWARRQKEVGGEDAVTPPEPWPEPDFDKLKNGAWFDDKGRPVKRVKRVKLTEGKQKGTRPRNERVPPRPPAPPAPRPKGDKPDHRETVS